MSHPEIRPNGRIGVILGGLLALGAPFALPQAAMSAELEPVRDVVELFTSQGCSSCPPADAHLAAIKGEQGLITLAWHVDYWDYLGWRDTLGHAESTRRQKTYAMMLGNKRLVTPQFVVNGRQVIDGARVAKVDAARAASELGKPGLSLDVTDERIVAKVDLDGLDAMPGECTVELLVLSPETPVEITRGENTGRTITYHNAVRSAHLLGMWEGPTATFEMPRQMLEVTADDTLVLVVRALDGAPRNRIIAAGIRPAALLN